MPIRFIGHPEPRVASFALRATAPVSAAAVFDSNVASKPSVVRLNADLTPDASFQSGAQIRVNFGTNQQESLLDAVLQSDKKIVLVGHSVALQPVVGTVL
ncbi:hypothetical protein [Pendulispora rubella]|uniref:hypothetical protein n=1 Tax=Pendulispora rubella TaxID=2741070 RepID=UPI00374E03C8